MPPQGRHFHLAGSIMLLYVGGAAAEEQGNNGKRYARQSRQKPLVRMDENNKKNHKISVWSIVASVVALLLSIAAMFKPISKNDINRIKDTVESVIETNITHYVDSSNIMGNTHP